MNIVQMILQLLTSSDTLGNIASTLGISHEQAGKGVNATVPSLLAGLVDSATKPGGGANLANALTKQDTGVFDNISSLFSGGSAATSQGSDVLGSLLGGSTVSKIGSVLSRFTGIDEGVTNKMLGMLTPVILGTISKHTRGLDAASIVSKLVAQKDNIVSAMPAGLSNMLSSAVPGLSSFLGGASHATASTDRTESYVPTGASRHGEPARDSVMKWLIPVICAVLLLLLLPRMCRRPTESPQVVKEPAVEATPEAGVSTKLTNDASSLIRNATENVASITDEASAKAALPKLQGDTEKLGSIRSMLASLPPSAQKTVVEALRPLVTKLRETAQPVLALPAVGALVKPTVDGLLGEIDKLMATPEAAVPPAQ